MECNKDEAVRAKTIAEEKMGRNDYIGAQKFALKAQNLYPSLVGIAQMLTIIDVYISAEYKICGEVDWYRVLGVTPSVDDETLRKHYRKLALVLHPDKNKSIGADGAFTLLQEAWNLLSDKSKRQAYNQQRSFNGVQHTVETPKNGPSGPSRANGYQTSSSWSAPTPKAQNTTGKAPPKAQNTSPKAPSKARNTTAKGPLKAKNNCGKGPLKGKNTTAKGPLKAQNTTGQAPLKSQNTTAKPPTKAQNSTTQAPSKAVPTSFERHSISFWTICHRCKMHYEYPRLYLNRVLLCPKCHEAFLASETSPPSSHGKSSGSASFQYEKVSSTRNSSVSLDPVINAPRSVPTGQSPSSYADSQRGLPPRSVVGNTLDPSIGFEQVQGKVRREHDADPQQGLSPRSAVANSPSVPTGQSPSSYADPLRGLPPRTAAGNSLDPSIGVTQAQGKVKRESDADPHRGLPPRSAVRNSLDPSIGFTQTRVKVKRKRDADPQLGVPPTNDVGNSLDPSIGFTQAQGKVKRECEASNIHSSFTIGETPLKKTKVGTDKYPFGGNMDHQAAMGINVFANFSTGSTGFFFNASWLPDYLANYQRPKGFRGMTSTELRKMLMGKCQNEIQTKLNEWKSKIVTEVGDVKNRNFKAGVQANFTKKQHSMNGNLAAESMSVPDSDFHDFDLDRSESSFEDGEVWAAYDDDDGMPRFYAMISNVISRVPFKVRLGWLNSKTNSEFSSIEWVGSGFYKTCGEFRVGRYEVSDSINSFSHKVKWFKGPRGTIHIFPPKGDVWALYSNWSADWNEHTPDEVIHKYEMALVLDDYNEEQGIPVAPLVKVAGFKTVFRQHMNPEKIKHIPKEEMFRFSHQVPNFFLTGEEMKNSPKDCQELDPAAIQVELLQVASEGEEMKNSPKDCQEFYPEAIQVELLQVASEDEEGQVTNNHADAKVMEMQSTAQVC